MKIGGFLYSRKFKRTSRKMLQIRKYITELLNVCYISVNTIDIIKKKNKIIVSKKGKK